MIIAITYDYNYAVCGKLITIVNDYSEKNVNDCNQLQLLL